MQGYFNNQIKDAELFRQINGDGECLGIVPKKKEEYIKKENLDNFDFNKNNYDMPDESVANSTNMGKVIEAEYSDETLIKYIKNSITEGKKYKDWFVLGRSNAQVEEMFNALSAHDIPCDTFKKADLTNEQLSDKMNTNTVKVLTIHSSKGLENDCVAVRGGVFWKPEERRVCYVAATRAKHMLLWFVQPKKKKKKKQDVFNWE